MRDHDMSKAAKGVLLTGSKKMVACVLAVPVISAYSTLLILVGHLTFVSTLAKSETAAPVVYIPNLGFLLVAGIPILISVALAVGAVVAVEIMYGKVTADPSTR